MEQSKFYQIKNITEHEYNLVGCDGSVITRPIQDIDKSASAFTIQDAKDGDVLYHKGPLTGIEYIVMSKGINGFGNIDSYFRYNSVDGLGTYIPSVFNAKSDDITPATKEQRDLLFQKIKEAGYEWDAEKKELKKIERNPGDWSEKDERILKNIISSILISRGSCEEDDDVKDMFDDEIDWLESLKQRMKRE